MNETLAAAELATLVRRVFSPRPADRGLAILVDVPDDRVPDTSDWRARREMAAAWHRGLAAQREALGLAAVTLAWYANAGGNNADLPTACSPVAAGAEPAPVPHHVRELAGRPTLPLADLLAGHGIVLAPTELSATAPLKVAAARAGAGPQGFRAATMPGFLPAMIPALRLDYGEINRRVDILKEWLDEADRALVRLEADGRPHELVLDLRGRRGHASGGLFPDNGVAGNLPSGEAYIAPYEGERPGDASASAGTLPVELDGELVVYRIAGNRAVAVLSAGPVSAREAGLIEREPAYANLAELGLGVLGDFGLQPCGSILLDEKLGLHLAFGRSDHLGGTVGPGDFSRPEAVVHLDRVYIPQTQPRVKVAEVALAGPGGRRTVIRNGAFLPLP